MEKRSLILAVETGLSKGSLCVLKNGEVIDSCVGREISIRSDNLLQLIKGIFEDNSLHFNELDSVVVSSGPGSFTGIRVGMATAQALSLGFNCRLVSLSVLDALSYGIEKNAPKIVVIAAGTNRLLWEFTDYTSLKGRDAKNNSYIKSGSIANFSEELEGLNLKDQEKLTIIAESSLEEILKLTTAPKNVKLTYASDNVAKLLGAYVYKKQYRDNKTK